ncbi:MAG: hypothetical protein IT380_27100 [Myxococcales bacterium]|nr:hypothetical protein [Myxococcales bacterium]
MSEQPPAPEPTKPQTPEEERERFIAELEKDVRRPGVGVLPPVAAIALCGALFLLVWMRADFAYFVSPRDPIELGAEGDYHLERAASNRYAQVHGVPSARGWYVDEAEGSFVIVGVNDTPLLLRRVTFPDEARDQAGKRPQPRQNPFFARGRLLGREDASRYADVFGQYEAWSGAKATWLLLAEQPPGADRSTLLYGSFLSVFALVNAWLLVRGLVGRRKKA